MHAIWCALRFVQQQYFIIHCLNFHFEVFTTITCTVYGMLQSQFHLKTSNSRIYSSNFNPIPIRLPKSFLWFLP